MNHKDIHSQWWKLESEDMSWESSIDLLIRHGYAYFSDSAGGDPFLICFASLTHDILPSICTEGNVTNYETARIELEYLADKLVDELDYESRRQSSFSLKIHQIYHNLTLNNLTDK